MLTKEMIESVIQKTDFPFAFIKFDQPQVPPYVVLTMDETNNIYSDLKFFQQVDTFTLEIYYRNPQDRFDFEKLLSEYFTWNRTATDSDIGQDGVMVSYYDVYELQT